MDWHLRFLEEDLKGISQVRLDAEEHVRWVDNDEFTGSSDYEDQIQEIKSQLEFEALQGKEQLEQNKQIVDDLQSQLKNDPDYEIYDKVKAKTRFWYITSSGALVGSIVSLMSMIFIYGSKLRDQARSSS
jgi:hypothetical protein